MENLYISLVLMFVSGITFIAYKHPRLYDQRLFWVFFFVSASVFFGATLFDGGVQFALNSLKEFIPSEKLIEAETAAKNIQSKPYISWGAMALWGYNFVLWIFGIMIQADRKNDK